MTIKVHTCTLHWEPQAVYVEHYMLPVKIETWVCNWLNQALAEFFFYGKQNDIPLLKIRLFFILPTFITHCKMIFLTLST